MWLFSLLRKWQKRKESSGAVVSDLLIPRGTIVTIYAFFHDMNTVSQIDAIVRAHMPDVYAYKKWIDQRYPVGRLVADFHIDREHVLLDNSLLATYASAGIPEETPLHVVPRGEGA